ncbi:alpha/beta fold hydrolase [Paenarthrobacter sp. NPDC056912]|uniref:alpha/beta fold hydrolase n=1 Tax=Paenarthrobacter sp. NPDC056912 TaxID=3345965 RepID=UPI00366DE367
MATFILVHGAGTGGWLWDAEAAELRRRGHRVYSPTLSGTGERTNDGGPGISLSTHIAEVRHLVQTLHDRVLLVGFSYGGLVVGGAAECVPHRIAALVYLDALMPENGRSMFDYLPAEVKTALQDAAATTGDGWRMPPVPLPKLGDLGPFGDGIDPDAIREVLAKRGAHPIGTYREHAKVSNAAAQRIPRIFIACTSHGGADPMTSAAEKARTAGIPVIEIETGHFPMLSKPVELADILSGAAATTEREHSAPSTAS